MDLEFLDSRKEADDVMSFVFQPKQPLVWVPGQYMDYEIPHSSPDSRGTHHWFTISSAPFEKTPTITTRLSPNGSSFKKALTALSPGDAVKSGLPRGDFIIADQDAHHVLIAGGIGITPYRSMLAQLDYENKHLKIDLLYLNKDDSYVFDDQLRRLAEKNNNLKIHKFTGSRLDDQDLDVFCKDPDTVFYLSGPRPMVESYQPLLESSVGPERVKTDYFPGY